MLAEFPISLDRVAWSGQTGRPAADSRHHDRDRGRVHLRQTQIVAYANSDPSSWPPRNDALGNRSRPPGVRNPSQRAGLKPIRHGTAHWTRSRCRQAKSLTRSLAGCGSPLSDQLTPKALFHRGSLRSDRVVRPHGVMSSGRHPWHDGKLYGWGRGSPKGTSSGSRRSGWEARRYRQRFMRPSNRSYVGRSQATIYGELPNDRAVARPNDLT